MGIGQQAGTVLRYIDNFLLSAPDTISLLPNTDSELDIGFDFMFEQT